MSVPRRLPTTRPDPLFMRSPVGGQHVLDEGNSLVTASAIRGHHSIRQMAFHFFRFWSRHVIYGFFQTSRNNDVRFWRPQWQTSLDIGDDFIFLIIKYAGGFFLGYCFFVVQWWRCVLSWLGSLNCGHNIGLSFSKGTANFTVISNGLESTAVASFIFTSGCRSSWKRKK